MWIRRDIFDALRDELLAERTRANVLEHQATTHRTQTAFLVGQINQLSKERVIMARQITRLDLPMPELAAVPVPAISQHDIIAAMGSSMFDDMGDDEARVTGVGWNASGEVEYAGHRKAVKGNGHA